MGKRKTRGRKRKLEAQRYPSGGTRHRGVDRGTAEAQARRAVLVYDGDRSKAAYPLGVLFANGAITESQHSAGCRLAWLYGVTFGRVSLAAMDYERERFRQLASNTSILPCDSIQAGCQAELSRLLSAMERESYRSRDEVVSVCVFEAMPRWALPCIPTPGDVAMAQEFTKGIKALELAIVSKQVMLTA